MKRLLFLPVFISLASLTGFTNHLFESIPAYTVLESKPDSTLQKTQSRFIFEFFNDKGEPISREIKFSYNGIAKTIRGDKNGKANFLVKPGNYAFQFYYNKNYYEVATDSIPAKAGYQTEVQIAFQSFSGHATIEKPVIYFYPTHTMSVKVNLELKGKLDFTYPAYENGWNFIADPDGTIHMNDKKYNYLFWDGRTEIKNDKINWNEGFVVSKDSLVSFFEAKLSVMGLNAKEMDDYITYWVPRMNVNETNYVHFLFNEEFSEYAPLTISPKPDHLFRVFMLWSKADDNMKPIPQNISTFQREGFSVVEWGGGEMEQLPI